MDTPKAKLAIESRKLWNITGRHITGIEVQLGDVTGRGKDTQSAIEQLTGNILPLLTYENLEPTVATYGGYTLIVYRSLHCWAYRLANSNSVAIGFATRAIATDAARDHVAQLLMDGKTLSRETVRDIAADKSLFDSLYSAQRVEYVPDAEVTR